MWIRSQDKTVLVKVQGIYIDSRFSVWSDGLLLGEYSTKEKALLVLDIIEKVSMYSGNTLFQMLADDEVEV